MLVALKFTGVCGAAAYFVFVEEKVEHIHHDITHGNKAMIKVLFGATATIITGLLSTIIVVVMNLPT